MKRLLPFLLFMIVAGGMRAQRNVEFTKANFPDRKAELKAALQDINDGDYYFSKGRQSIIYALQFYIRANDFNPDNAELNFKIGKCYLRALPESEALVFLKKAKQLDPNVSDEYDYVLGQAYQRNLMFDQAIAAYKRFMGRMSPEQSAKYRAELKRKIAECKYGKEMLQKPVRVIIENLGAGINSEYADYWPVISMDESRLFFTSRRAQTTGGLIDYEDEQYFEDIYFSDFRNGYWTPAKNIGSPINTKRHDAVVGRSPDGQLLLIYRNEKGNGGDIYWSKLNGNNWTRPKAFAKPVNSDYHESSATISYDGRRIFFVSNRPGGYGGKDIYYCDLLPNGKWSEAVNMGPVVNTKQDEVGVFMQADGRTLYFSSNGHAGMGSFDIYKTVYDKGRWRKPENLGYPINTPDPDAFFTIAANGRHAYFSSVREGGMGDYDIYLITFLGPEKPVVDNTEDMLLVMRKAHTYKEHAEAQIAIMEQRLLLLKGRVSDALSGHSIEAEIELVDNDRKRVLATFHSNSATGKYLVSLPAGHNYGLAVKAKGYLFHSENFVIPDSAGYSELVLNIKLKPVAVGNKILLNNIFFDYEKSDLSPASITELNRVLKLMTDYPKMKIEVSGHTDNVGSREYNLKLSTRRAKAVADYLIAHGINAGRITYKGFGFDQPVADNSTEEGRKRNRRSEIKIIEM